MSEQSAKSTGRPGMTSVSQGRIGPWRPGLRPLDLIDDTLAATAEKGHRIGRSGRGHAWLTLAGPRAVLAGGAVALGLAAILVASLVFRSTPSAGSGSSSALPSASSTPMTLSIENDTTIAVTLVVNGKVIETVPAGGLPGPHQSRAARSPVERRDSLAKRSIALVHDRPRRRCLADNPTERKRRATRRCRPR